MFNGFAKYLIKFFVYSFNIDVVMFHIGFVKDMLGKDGFEMLNIYLAPVRTFWRGVPSDYQVVRGIYFTFWRGVAEPEPPFSKAYALQTFQSSKSRVRYLSSIFHEHVTVTYTR